MYKRGIIIEAWYKNREDGILISCYSKWKAPSGLSCEEYSEPIVGTLYTRLMPSDTTYVNENFTIEEIERRIKITKGEI